MNNFDNDCKVTKILSHKKLAVSHDTANFTMILYAFEIFSLMAFIEM